MFIFFKTLPLIIFFLFLPTILFAVNQDIVKDQVFKAQVIKILKQEISTLDNGIKSEQQDLELQGTEGGFKNRVVEFKGIGNFDVINKNLYQVGDYVMVAATYDDQGEVRYFVTDYVRSPVLKWLFILFILVLLIFGRLKGLLSLLSLSFSSWVIMQFTLPKIIAGSNPILITLISAIIITAVMIYTSEGFNRLAHTAVLSILLSLSLVLGLSWIFVYLAHLSGMSSEETGSLLSLGGNLSNFKGLLLAGIIIGALGVLDDVVLSQITAVDELNKSNPNLSKLELYKRAYNIGLSHINSMVNTLFLAYAGVSLPLLILFSSGASAFSSLSQIVNNEELATEIVRTLAGSIGLILAVPIATSLAVVYVKKLR